MGREDLIVILIEFERKRDLSILLHFFAKEKHSLKLFNQSSATEAASHLVLPMERFFRQRIPERDDK